MVHVTNLSVCPGNVAGRPASSAARCSPIRRTSSIIPGASTCEPPTSSRWLGSRYAPLRSWRISPHRRQCFLLTTVTSPGDASPSTSRVRSSIHSWPRVRQSERLTIDLSMGQPGHSPRRSSARRSRHRSNPDRQAGLSSMWSTKPGPPSDSADPQNGQRSDPVHTGPSRYAVPVRIPITPGGPRYS